VKRRFRPLGLSLAILAVFLTLGFFPLIPALFVVLLKAEGHTIDPGESAFWLPSLVGIVVLVLSVFAWIGRACWRCWSRFTKRSVPHAWISAVAGSAAAAWITPFKVFSLH